MERILVARIGALGDTLMALPAVRFLKTSFNRRVDFLCTAGLVPLVRMFPWVDRVYGLKSRNVPLAVSAEKRRLARTLSQNRYDRAVVMESAPHFVRLLEQASIPEIRSYIETPFQADSHSTQNNLRLCGARMALEEAPSVDLDLSVPECRGAGQLLDGLATPVIGLHAGYGPAHRKEGQSRRLKGWPLRSFVGLARALQSSGASIVLTGSEQDEEDCRRLARDLDPCATRVLAGRTTLPQLAALLRHLQLCVCVDSGPAHLCAAVGTPLIVLWGPAKWVQTRPLCNGGEVIVLRTELPCAPCYDTPAMKSCLKNVCMESIGAAQVLAHCQGLLERGPGAGTIDQAPS